VTKRTNGAATAAPRSRSGGHVNPRVPLSAPQKAWDFWRLAAVTAGDDSWAEWARHALTIQAAEELGVDPVTALGVLSEG
jgi:hypothetical protein